MVVRQGHSKRAAENELLGEFRLELRPAPRMEPKLDVTFRLDLSGMLHVTATDRATEERQKIVIRNYVESVAEGAQVEVDRDTTVGRRLERGPLSAVRRL